MDKFQKMSFCYNEGQSDFVFLNKQTWKWLNKNRTG